MSQTDLTRAVITPANAPGLKRVRQLGSQLDSVRWERLCFDPSGTRLLAKDARDFRLRWWNLGTSTDVASGSVELKMEPIEALFHGPNHIVTAGPPVAEAAVTWRPRLMALSTADGSLWREETLSAPATGLAMSRDGMLLAVLERGEALLWDGRVLRMFNDYSHYVSNLDFSPDGELIVSSAGGRGFALYHFDTGELLFSHSEDDKLETGDAVFSPDGRFIAWAQGDGTVGLWGVGPVA
ncbi:WD40 repeat domain-containing protein [Corallococcus exiguus]|uniref:WD40 repeat domain-containing protein n=1 Tax=Corallococcus exiguus TaxID=83462 RepID=UPI001A905ADB|nr:WD40 repeat domain-containing protein [Corallococcus exiguus]MBN8471680.1 WD40 repeat domain-containing protein [Corallococcus exiguus]